MRIEHVAIYVQDLENAKRFFVEQLGGKTGDLYHNAKTGFRSYFISFDGGARLEIMSKPGVGGSLSADSLHESLGYAHVAFSVGSKEKVDAVTAALKAAGYDVLSGPRTTGDGYYECCVAAIEGIRVEITV